MLPNADGIDTVSEIHARIQPAAGGAYLLEDLHSSNGVFVYEQGRWQRVNSGTVLADTRIRFGAYETTAGSLMERVILNSSAPLTQTRTGVHSLRPTHSTGHTTIWQHFLNCYSKDAFNFDGRASRSEYWGMILITFMAIWSLLVFAFVVDLFSIQLSMSNITAISAAVTDNPFEMLDTFASRCDFICLKVVAVIIVLGSFFPGLSVFVRRMHDTGRSGWLWLLNLAPLGVRLLGLLFPGIHPFVYLFLWLIVPVIIPLYLVILLCSVGDEVNNEFGAPPAK